MPRKSISFELDFMTKDILPKFTVKQFDDISFNIKPKNQGLDYNTAGMTGKIFIGINNDVFMQTTGITVSSNNINVLLDKNMLQKNGRAYAEIELSDSAGVITSSSFIFDIDSKIGEGATIPGSIEGFVAKYERLISEFKSQVNEAISNCNANVDNKLNTVDSLINVKISDFEKRFNRLTSSQQQDAEVIDARTDFKGVVFDSLKERIDYTDKILRESTVSTVTTESDFTTVEATSNGYFEDVKLEGKTLIASNYIEKTTMYARFKVKPNTDYTYVMTGLETTYFGVFDKLISGTPIKHYERGQINAFNSGNNDEVVIHKSDDYDVDNLGGSFLIEGDHTQNPPSYFEGLKSVGQSASEDGVEEIVVLSVKGDGNLCPMKDFVVSSKNNGWNNFKLVSYFEKNTSYTISGSHRCSVEGKNPRLIFKYTDGTVSYNNDIATTTLSQFDITSDKNKTLELIKMTWSSSSGDMDYEINNVTLIKGDTPKPYIPHQSDKKRLLYYNNETQAWEKPILRQWDSIEKHANGKYYYHQRSGEVVFDENSVFSKRASIGILDRYDYVTKDRKLNDNLFICDKFKVIPATYTIVEADNYTVSHNTQDKLIFNMQNTPTVEDCKTKMKGVTVVYQLAEEKVYECTNIDLITYANETNYIIESGAIVPKTTLKVHNNISNVVSLLQKKVSLLESDITSYMITQNRLMLASRYNADTVSFKVDVASFSDTFEYDNDLYELILNNILVGKDNYNREYIENLIIFYWMDFIISDEMYSTLFEIIEEQHDPKIEEETPLI